MIWAERREKALAKAKSDTRPPKPHRCQTCDSCLIDRLVLGQPDPKVLSKRCAELQSAGTTFNEIAAMCGLSAEAVEKRVSRYRRTPRRTAR